ncbi:protein Hook homolog 1-like isoform X4 [Penaeus monodon]|uniref:protein Hook homolog 1-like isoform X4 n=1 Tax=Penaeus monodon TaxID=6687 RepID=UPI0018A7D8C6|nr:protein Hook homolog 1-like isoform X4 [Penaeus monodon]
MFGLLLFSFCVAGWAASTPTGDATSETPYAHERCPCVVLRQEDFAHLLADFRNISEGLHEVTPGMQRLSEVLSPLLQEDSIFGREIRSCTNISEVLQARTSLNENQIREQQEANTQLKAKRREMEERIRQARITKQQLQEKLLQLQMEELQLKHEEVQAKTKSLEAKSALQKAVGEEAQLNSEIGLLEQELQFAKERDQHIETLVDILRQNVTQAISAKSTLIQNKNDQADLVTSLSQTLNNTVDMINHLSQENNQLREKKDQIDAACQSLKETKQHLEQKRGALTTQRAKLSTSVEQVTEEKDRLLLSIETLNMDLDQIEFNLRKAKQELSTCDRLSDIEWVF